ncbi:Na/Pi cotransporter family protein [Pseudodesulfovibrio piezophilus]|uniref:Na/Pi-cotransporter II-related protein n=1 Tax=Pseudodesulfovibrio piezophilus (strain DSM 21447 / JCM 15486 / C1TLV30) TaxID=1322246 RepID=M1WNA0_PSEP2|nr:Na/Pi symporter [Pseudodesulfovibrio piezophilus]CCH47434.1 Na/Pi-cotransporter II-related protein [Pseudodesulfovibrio piezophilus C1TLV30]
MIFSILGGLCGGLGLFLLGMRLMTQGLRNTAGPSLRKILGQWTKTPLRGLFSGFMITALVQSSSAITVAVIGFVNAGLMTMGQSVGVIFGSNIGTTATGWIVAAVGVSVKVKALALPLIGIGAILRLTGGDSPRKHLGDALTGFGIFFLGIEILQSTFHDVESIIDLTILNFAGIQGIVIFVLVGFMLTLVMQSSSAAMALVLTATMSGVVNLECAAAAVIGTNIGTTSTAAMSVIGATDNAKKVASAHILFNLGTGIAATFLIPLFLNIVHNFQPLAEISNPATCLAIFHTTFNLLGVILFLPFTNQLVHFLNERIGKEAADNGKPKYLDSNVLKAPTLAMDALFMELGRLGETIRHIGQKALTSKFRHKDFIKDKAAVESLIVAIRKYCATMQLNNLPASVAENLPLALRVIQYYRKSLNIIDEASSEHAVLNHQLPGIASESARNFRREIREILNVAHTPCSPEFANLAHLMQNLDSHYHELKEELLRIGAQGRLELDRMVSLLDYYSSMRMMCEQAIKGTTYWTLLRDMKTTCAHADQANNYAWKLAG